MGKLKHPTYTNLVMEALRKKDDFMNVRMLVEETRCTRSQVTAGLHNLRQSHVVDVVIQPDGSAWWFALPPEQDTRLRRVAEMPDGIKRKRKPRVKPVS